MFGIMFQSSNADQHSLHPKTKKRGSYFELLMVYVVFHHCDFLIYIIFILLLVERARMKVPAAFPHKVAVLESGVMVCLRCYHYSITSSKLHGAIPQFQKNISQSVL